MKEKPILFSTEMFRAILAGNKTQTRRVIKPRYRKNETGLEVSIGNLGRYINIIDEHGCHTRDYSPLYEIGDILWVRETWQENTIHNEKDKKEIPYLYKADPDGVLLRSWKPSIHMPRKAARLFLEVKSVRVERLQDITGIDVLAEGIDNGRSKSIITEKCWENMQRESFAEIWNKYYAKRGYSWNSNPWVFVYEFEKMEGK